MPDQRDDQRERNTGIVPAAAASILRTKTVAIAGVGGVGGLTATMLVRQCPLRALKLADVDVFDWSNLNRQEGAYHSTVGRPKLDTIVGLCRDIDPRVDVVPYAGGVGVANQDEFLGGVDLLVNAVDYTVPHVYVPLTDRAHRLGVPVVVGAEVGYGCRAVWFDPAGMSYARYFRVDAAGRLPLWRLMVSVPAYGDLRAVKAVVRGEIPAPATATGALCTASVLVPWIEAILCGIDVPRAAPYAYVHDVKARQSRYVRRPRAAFAVSLPKALLRAAFGRTTPTL